MVRSYLLFSGVFCCLVRRLLEEFRIPLSDEIENLSARYFADKIVKSFIFQAATVSIPSER